MKEQPVFSLNKRCSAALVRMCGNSVTPAEALARANFAHEAQIYVREPA